MTAQPDVIDQPDVTDRKIESLPLDAWHRARGARMVAFAGYSMPIQYEGIVAEHLWTRAHAGLFDVSHMGQLLISGHDAASALETLLPSDVIGLARNRMRYSLLLEANGGILDDLMITSRDDGYYVVVNGAVKHDDIAHFREHLPDSVTINHMEDRALIAVQGPEAVGVVSRVVPGVEALFFMEAAAFGGPFGDLWVSRSGYTGEDGVEISVPCTTVEALVEALSAQPEVKPIGLGARDSLRLEAGLPLNGHDLCSEIDPVMAQLTFAIPQRRRGEGGFPGAERIQAAFGEGTLHRRVGLAVEGRQPAREGAGVYSGDELIGMITSGGFAPSLQYPIAMGYIRVAHAAAGTRLEIDVRGKRLAATVTPMPFIPNRYHRRGKAP